MRDPFVDTDVLIRLLTGDDVAKQQAARRLFIQVEAGELVLQAPDTVIADAVFVLSSRVTYDLPRAEIRELLSTLLRLPNFRVDNRQTLLSALDLYASGNLDFGDAMIAASMLNTGTDQLYSYDRDFDRFPWLSRIEP